MTESIEDLEKRHSLLHAIKQLEDEVGKVSIEDLEKRYSLVHAIKETLKEMDEYAEASEDEMRAASAHLATLKKIQEHPEH